MASLHHAKNKANDRENALLKRGRRTDQMLQFY